MDAVQKAARIACVEVDAAGAVRSPSGVSAFLGLARQPRFVEELTGGMVAASADLFLAQMVRKSGGAFEIEVEMAGTPVRWLRVVRDDASELLVFQDITDTRRARDEVMRLNASLERRVQRRTRQLQAANRELETFAYSVSHDLKTPLSAIDGFAHVLGEKLRGRIEPQEATYLEKIRGSVTSAFGLIDALLELSRLSTLDRIERKRVDLTALAGTIAADLRDRDPGRQAEWQIDPGMVVEGDPALLASVMRNLLDNAWKFTGTRARALIEVRLEKESTPGFCTLLVRDNGVGFDGTRAGKLFTPFHRLHRKSEFPGSGIGLATVQRIVHRHGGSIRASGEPGVGAAFIVTLPHSDNGLPDSTNY